ncbi:MAG: glutamate racemase [Bacteroidaceae bacterium]|nr:glutamate racemase [Bacteroidaceae bacterium]
MTHASDNAAGSIGIFDSGYGGLTILRQIRQYLPEYDYIYLGDNARAPYGPRSFEVVYAYTLQAVEALYRRGCNLVILACNTASAKALRTIQENDLPRWGGAKRVLGVIRPTVEALGDITRTRHVGLLATPGTVGSRSYELELQKLYGDIRLTSVACPMWVALVEYGEFDSPGADYFIRKRIETVMRKDPEVDTLILGCTHFPLLMEKITKYTPPGVRLVPQGEYVARSLAAYLGRHAQMRARCTTGGTCRFLTTESAETFRRTASIFLHKQVKEVEKIEL